VGLGGKERALGQVLDARNLNPKNTLCHVLDAHTNSRPTPLAAVKPRHLVAPLL
jgi:hypothetical protein